MRLIFFSYEGDNFPSAAPLGVQSKSPSDRKLWYVLIFLNKFSHTTHLFTSLCTRPRARWNFLSQMPGGLLVAKSSNQQPGSYKRNENHNHTLCKILIRTWKRAKKSQCKWASLLLEREGWLWCCVFPDGVWLLSWLETINKIREKEHPFLHRAEGSVWRVSRCRSHGQVAVYWWTRGRGSGRS